MNEPQVDAEVCKGFLLALRIAFRDLPSRELSEKSMDCLKVAGQLATSAKTLHESVYDCGPIEPDMRQQFVGLANRGVVGDRETAVRVMGPLSNPPRSDGGENVEAKPPHDSAVRLDSGGTMRVGGTRIQLDLIVREYENGSSPEEIVLAYDVLKLADVYSAIAYYLRHRSAVDEYIAIRKKAADELQATIEARRPRLDRAELLARLEQRKRDHAPIGD